MHTKRPCLKSLYMHNMTTCSKPRTYAADAPLLYGAASEASEKCMDSVRVVKKPREYAARIPLLQGSGSEAILQVAEATLKCKDYARRKIKPRKNARSMRGGD